MSHLQSQMYTVYRQGFILDHRQKKNISLTLNSLFYFADLTKLQLLLKVQKNEENEKKKKTEMFLLRLSTLQLNE